MDRRQMLLEGVDDSARHWPIHAVHPSTMTMRAALFVTRLADALFRASL